MRSAKQGFTIIEVVIVFAISSLLFLIISFGQGSVRTRAQFTDSIEQLFSKVETIQSEANTTLTLNSTPNASRIAVGRAVVFGGSNLNEAEVYTIVSDREQNVVVQQNYQNLTLENASTFNLEWGVEFDSTSYSEFAIAFMRDPGNGEPRTYSFVASGGSVDLTDETIYSDSSNLSVRHARFVSPEGLPARITVNDSPNGLSKEFN